MDCQQQIQITPYIPHNTVKRHQITTHRLTTVNSSSHTSPTIQKQFNLTITNQPNGRPHARKSILTARRLGGHWGPRSSGWRSVAPLSDLPKAATRTVPKSPQKAQEYIVYIATEWLVEEALHLRELQLPPGLSDYGRYGDSITLQKPTFSDKTRQGLRNHREHFML